MCKVYCRELGQYFMQSDALEKPTRDYKLQYLKIVTNGHQYTKNTEDEKFLFWINAHTPVEKQSNQDWNTPIHSKNNGSYKCYLDLLVFYHDFLLIFLSTIVG